MKHLQRLGYGIIALLGMFAMASIVAGLVTLVFKFWYVSLVLLFLAFAYACGMERFQ